VDPTQRIIDHGGRHGRAGRVSWRGSTSGPPFLVDQALGERRPERTLLRFMLSDFGGLAKARLLSWASLLGKRTEISPCGRAQEWVHMKGWEGGSSLVKHGRRGWLGEAHIPAPVLPAQRG